MCLAVIDRAKGKQLEQKFFDYPDDMNNVLSFINEHKATKDVYFAPFLLTRERRRKIDVAETPVAWADGDDCPVESLLVQPSAVIRTSEGRHSFFWKFDDVQPPDVGEIVSKRIAYYHEPEGMDQGGWDLSQLLRVPDSYNHKYSPPHIIKKAVINYDVKYLVEEFDVYPEVEATLNFEPLDMSTIPNKKPEDILEAYKNILNPMVFDMYETVPVNDWSAKLWNLECSLVEAELPLEEAFIVARNAACNKYRREQRSDQFIWKELQKAQAHVKERNEGPPEPDGPTPLTLSHPVLLTDEERESVKQDITFIEEYVSWAKQLGDAAEQYHPAGAFIILSTLLSGNVKLPTSFGTVIPNMWFMILADTTLTRKSTAMDNATDLLMEVDDDSLLATDGSVEGLLTALGTRPNRPSLFLRDEVTGLIESMSKKEYMAGMMETLTKLYDGKHMKRILRKETIDVRDPILVIFAGGIRNKMTQILDNNHISSGFLPRFIFVTAESDVSRLKPVGPPTTKNIEGRQRLVNKLIEIHANYAVAVKAAEGNKVSMPKRWLAELTDDAWYMYNKFEMEMLKFAMDWHDTSTMTPMMDRLAKSGLKASVLIAASRIHEDKIIVDTTDVLHAFYYIEQWAKHSIYMLSNVGATGDERKLQRILQQITGTPGITRSALMQRNFLNAKETDNIFNTLEQRNAIRREKRNTRAERLFPLA